MSDDGGSRPSGPDPTVMTTEQLERGLTSLRELVESEIKASVDLCNEQFRAVNKQLELVERQRVEQKADTKAAVDAALTAQKEAVKEQTTASDRAIAKSEAGTSEQLKQMRALFDTNIASLAATLTDVKDQVSAITFTKLGGQEVKAQSSSVTNNIGTILGVLVGLAGVIVAAVVALSR